MMIRVQVPPEGDRLALEKHDTAVDNSDYAAAVHDGFDDHDVVSVDCDPEEEETNGGFEQCSAERVENFTKEPILNRVSQACAVDVARRTINPIWAVSSVNTARCLPFPCARLPS